MRASPAFFARTAGESRYPQLWRGLVGAWCPSLGPTGATLRDWSGRKKHGSIQDATLSSFWEISQGYCLHFDAVNDYVSIGSVISGATNFTVSLWINPDTLFNFQCALRLDGADPTSTGSTEHDMQLTVDGNIYIGNLSGNFKLSDTNQVVAGQWQHIRWSQRGQTWRLYRNGQSMFATEDQAALAQATVGNVNIGTGWAARFFDGRIDDLLIYNRDMNQSEGRRLYELGRGGICEPRQRRFFRVGGGRLLELRRRACA